ncbi:MAG: branched-chain amino acid ABC transporter permease, partial [Alphaproteobacteria bacterium]|nr:branched-chain amino acid ABC transporter permease [Alphaproteobacteria bacterium]
MLYREAGQFKTTYRADMAIFPLLQDRWGVIVIVAIAAFGVPFIFSDYVISAWLIPVLIWSLAAIGLNILTGYCGQLSIGHGAFMAVGAYASYNLAVRVPEVPLILVFIFGGVVAALFGIVIGLPSLRVKGFYLAVATLAAQFFVEWVFGTFSWFTGGKMSMVLDTPPMEIMGYRIESTLDNYYLVLGFVVVMTL